MEILIKRTESLTNDESIELIWHYAPATYLEKILTSGELKVSASEKKRKVNHPALWLSKNPIWENTATKNITESGIERSLTKEEMHNKFGLIRFTLEFDKNSFITWAKYRYKTNTPDKFYFTMEQVGIKQGANPKEWFASFKNIPLTDCLSIEKWDGTKWNVIS